MNPAVATDPLDTAAIRRAKQVLAGVVPFDGPEQARLQSALAAAGPIEHGALRAIIIQVEARAREQIERAAGARMEREHAARNAHRAARPERWAALSNLERALFLVAGESAPELRGALLRLAAILATETATQTPPELFENTAPRW
jgi:hypothetical protein